MSNESSNIMTDQPLIPQFLIAAPTSGSGKTLVARGLMATLARRGLQVQPFKGGPDYIDTKFHAWAAGRPSVNLDLFMASATHVEELYAHYAQGADACIVEGMMGLFDGYDRDRGSSASLAELLHLPVVLVVNAQSAAYSTAALIAGFLHFHPALQIAGVLFNRVGSTRHFAMLQEVCADLQVPCFGYLPKDPLLEQSSRYLGLDFSQVERSDSWERLMSYMEETVRLEALLEATRLPAPLPADPFRSVERRPVRIVVARHPESFTFIYTQHLDLLGRMGEVSFFDPEQNKPLPEDTELLYLPGGYPEKQVDRLSQASCSRESIRRYIEAGGRTLAECGGMIYLSQGLRVDERPEPWPLVGALPFAITAERAYKKLHLGYRQGSYQGVQLRGHEFHYTCVADPESAPPSIVQLSDAKGHPCATPVFRQERLLASYMHLYWGELDIWKLLDETK